MDRISRAVSGAAVGLVATLAVAGCGSSGTSNGSSAQTPASGPSSAGIHVAHTSLGDVLVDGADHTLYLLTADGPDKSTCAGACLSVWPAVAPPASGVKLPGVTAKVSSTTTPGGTSIVTVGGWPLYTFAQDQAPGEVNGEGVQSFGGTWYAVSAAGKQVAAGASSSASPSSGGGYGNGY